jgi:hypothetical protein
MCVVGGLPFARGDLPLRAECALPQTGSKKHPLHLNSAYFKIIDVKNLRKSTIFCQTKQ